MDVRRSLPGGARSRRRRALAPSIVLCLSFALFAGPALASETAQGLAGVTLDSSGGTLSGVEIRVGPLGRSAGTLPLQRALSDEQGRFALAALGAGGVPRRRDQGRR